MRQGRHHIDKFDFLKIYPGACKEAFTLDSIVSSFRATGLIPLNPEEVLSRCPIQLKISTLPGSQSTNSAPKTPHNHKQLESRQICLSSYSETHTQSPSPAKSTLNRLIKGCENGF